MKNDRKSYLFNYFYNKNMVKTFQEVKDISDLLKKDGPE